MSIEKVFLDTDILSEYFKKRDVTVGAHAANYAAIFNQFTFSSMTAYEIVFGLESRQATVQLASALTWIKRHEEVVPTAEDFLTAARIKAAARRGGKVVEFPDLIIAASASRLKLPLVTGNTADFEAMRDAGLQLELRNWRLP